MVKLVPIVLSLFLSLILRAQGTEIGCNLLPPNREKSEASTEPTFGISMNASTEFTVGGYPVEVTLTNVNTHPNQVRSFNIFILQAHDILDRVHGRWEPLSDTHQTRGCGSGQKDTLYNGENMTEQVSVTGLWYPEFSESEVVPNKDIDFNAAILLDDGTFWTDIRSSILKARDVHSDPRETEEPVADPDDETEAGGNEEPEVDGTGEDPNAGEETDARETEQENDRDNTDDDHGRQEEEEMLIKYREEMEEMVREEDAESEGDWVREEEEEKQRQEEEQHREMVEYERLMAEEERKRQEMIRWEIQDKEEHDRLMAEQTTVKQPPKKDDDDKPPKDDDKNKIIPDFEVKDNGAAVPVFSVVFTLLPVLLQLV